jgi:hypothetical protein
VQASVQVGGESLSRFLEKMLESVVFIQPKCVVESGVTLKYRSQKRGTLTAS